MAFSLKNLVSLVQVALQHHASDIHLREDEPPALRIRGDLVPVQTKAFSRTEMLDLCKIFFPDEKMLAQVDSIKEWDGGYTIDGLCRLRINFFHFNEKKGIVLRLVKNAIPSLKSLGLNSTLAKIALQKRGLILVTGATGSGKSTTLAAMVNEINQNRASHIVTIEDPIEYLHPQNKSRLSQREVGKDTENFQAGLRAALRQDPDVILIGEMRDPETVSIALKAAETGHLVMSTVHTTNSVATIGRIISLFPPSEQDDVRKRLAENLYATIGQRMLKSVEKKGVVIAQEIMITSPGVKECILGEEPLSRIHAIIEEGHKAGGNGSQSFDQHIMELFEAGLISKESAMSASSSESDFMQKMLING